jgi:hypothetical protein
VAEASPSILESWLLREEPRHFVLGHILRRSTEFGWVSDDELADKGIGTWECDLLQQNKLTWSGAVYDIFGFSQGSDVSRDQAVASYCTPSREILERIRSYAIDHSRAFILDAEINAAAGMQRWMRIVAEPVVSDQGVVGLRGLKLPL